ncbi:hypothetical protein I551_7091 [Mycobacterium ulcerans str. Harvey]|uniref:Uncharacterized protein n=1 Tax=Mycobacterium ulcerans str. Harvey TaxID=1299332 RepID=A0ABN0QP52_MYCUL|nr:hypothetical protein I551_7091 [Mycobacterium ulcerans str. Harvey]
MVTRHGQCGVGDVEMEVFGHLELCQYFANFHPDPPAPASRPQATAAMIGASAASVTVSNSARLRRVGSPTVGYDTR